MVKYKNKEELALDIIRHYIQAKQIPDIASDDVPEKLHPVGACFVTVYINGNLRGCIGNAEAYEPLYKNIISNAVNAVSRDFRFPTIRSDELERLTVEVSVLTPPEKYRPASPSELLKFLSQKKPGLILKNGSRGALFLPSVWDDIPDPRDFLTQLCHKAGLESDDWQKSDTGFRIFSTRKDI